MTLKKIISKLQKHAATMPDEPQVQLSSDANKTNEDSKSGAGLGMVSSYASWAVSSVAAKVTGKSSEDSAKDDEPKSRMGDIDRSKFKNKQMDSPLNKSKKKKPKKILVDDDIDIGPDAGDDDFDFDFSDKEEEEEVEAFDLSIRKKKKRKDKTGGSRPSSRSKKKVSSP